METSESVCVGAYENHVSKPNWKYYNMSVRSFHKSKFATKYYSSHYRKMIFKNVYYLNPLEILESKKNVQFLIRISSRVQKSDTDCQMDLIQKTLNKRKLARFYVNVCQNKSWMRKKCFFKRSETLCDVKIK